MNKEKIYLMTIEDVAKILNVKTSWVRSAVFRKKIPYIKVGNLLRFKKEELCKWMQKNLILPIE